jgi:hypothetical protein
LSIHLLITSVQDGRDEGSYSFEGRGIVLLVLAKIPRHYASNYEPLGLDRICLVIEGNGEGTQEFKQVGLCRLQEWIWNEVFWAPRTVIIV